MERNTKPLLTCAQLPQNASTANALLLLTHGGALKPVISLPNQGNGRLVVHVQVSNIADTAGVIWSVAFESYALLFGFKAKAEPLCGANSPFRRVYNHWWWSKKWGCCVRRKEMNQPFIIASNLSSLFGKQSSQVHFSSSPSCLIYFTLTAEA